MIIVYAATLGLFYFLWLIGGIFGSGMLAVSVLEVCGIINISYSFCIMKQRFNITCKPMCVTPK